MSDDYTETARDVTALIRAYNKDPRPGVLEGEEIQAILQGANLYHVTGLLLWLNYEMLASWAALAGEPDTGQMMERVLSGILVELRDGEIQGGG